MTVTLLHYKKMIARALLIASISLTAHAAKKDGGFVEYPNMSANTGSVVFSHRSHGSAGAGYQCKSCHSTTSGETLNVTMDRFRAAQACSACHDGRTKGPRGRQAASAVSDCSSCHMPGEDVIIKLNRMDAVPFSHTRHLGVGTPNSDSRLTGLSCIDCHPIPFELGVKGPPRMELPHERGGCAQCHNGRKRKDGMPTAFAATARCVTCHKPPDPSSPAQ
jgi:c(7)-type cytochrome triheme protein